MRILRRKKLESSRVESREVVYLETEMVDAK